MNMQRLMQEAQKMQKQIKKEQDELEKTVYEGSSSNVSVKMNGKYEIVSVDIKFDESISEEDKEMYEDMVMLAVNDAVKKISLDKEKRLSKYGQGLAGLM